MATWKTGIQKDPDSEAPITRPGPKESIAIGVGCVDIILGLFVLIFQARSLWLHFPRSS